MPGPRLSRKYTGKARLRAAYVQPLQTALVYSISATAWAAMPRPSPVKPRCYSVVAFTLTASNGRPKASAMFWRMAGMCGASLGRWHKIVASMLPTL